MWWSFIPLSPMNVTEVILEHHLLSNTFSSFRTIFKFALIEKREGHNHDRNKQRQLASFKVSLLMCVWHAHIYVQICFHIYRHTCLCVCECALCECVLCMCLCTQEYVWETPRWGHPPLLFYLIHWSMDSPLNSDYTDMAGLVIQFALGISCVLHFCCD